MNNLACINCDNNNLFFNKTTMRQWLGQQLILVISFFTSSVYGESLQNIQLCMLVATPNHQPCVLAPNHQNVQPSMLPAIQNDQKAPINFYYPEESSWIDDTEYYFSEAVHDFSTLLDQGLAKQDDEEELVNKSYLKIKYRTEYSHHGGVISDERVSIRIDLPHVKRNWSLILETDPDDYDSLESKQRGLSSGESKNGPDGPVGGIRLQDEELYNWITNLDLGVKIRIPLDPFVRGELQRVEELSQEWTVQFKQDIFYYHSLGSGSLTELNFYHTLTEDHAQIFKAGSSAQYIYEDDNWELLFQFKYFDRVSNNHLLEYSTGISIEPNKTNEVANLWISASWKRKIYSRWLYLSLTPQIDAPRELDYKFNIGFQLKLEAFFSKNRDLDLLNRHIPRSTKVTD